MRMMDTMHRLRTKYAGVESYRLAQPIDTSVRIKDGLLRFDMPDDNTFKSPAKMRLQWQGNPLDPLLMVHYITPPYEGVALGTRQFRAGRVCTRLALLATARDTTILAGGLTRSEDGLQLDYTNLGQELGFYADEITGNMDVVVLNKLTRNESRILAGETPS